MGSSVFATLNAGLLLYAIHRFIGFPESIDDLTFRVTAQKDTLGALAHSEAFATFVDGSPTELAAILNEGTPKTLSTPAVPRNTSLKKTLLTRSLSFQVSGAWPRIFKPILHKFNGQSSSHIGMGMRCNTKGSTPTWSCTLFWFALACVQITGSTTASAQEHQYEPEDTLRVLGPTELAITVDDLPAHSSVHPGMTRLEIAAEMIAALQAGGSPPAYGFTNGTPLEWDPAAGDVLRMWHDAGYLLANHTYSHLDLAQVSAETFIGDIERMDRALTPWASASSEKLFRYPYLSEGDTRAKRRSVRQYLKQAGYRIAPVTVDYNDWAWSAAYTRCSLAHDDAAMRQLQDQVVTVSSS